MAPQLADQACAGSETNVRQRPLCQSGTTCSLRQKSLCFCLELDMVTRLENLRQLLKPKPLAGPCSRTEQPTCCAVIKRDCDSLFYLAQVSSVLLCVHSCAPVRSCLCFRVGLCIDSLCSQLISFSHPSALNGGVEWDCCPWSLEAYV